MKKVIFTLSMLLVIAIADAQPSDLFSADSMFNSGSRITTIATDKKKIENLKTLGLIWGFLKYYHPVVAKGTLNWDYELFRILPKLLNAGTAAARDDSLVSWISGLGEIEAGKQKAMDTTNLKMAPDLAWISDSKLSAALSTLLRNIQNTKRNGENYYVSLKRGVGNPDFKNEEAYKTMTYPDTGFRLLSLYRYWNIIQYFFPYKNLMHGDWKNVLEEFIPKVLNAKNETEYVLTMLELIGRVKDTHANIWGANAALGNYWGKRYSAVDISFVEGKAVVTGFFDADKGKLSGLNPGDVISTIDGKTVELIVKEQLKFSPASNYSTQLRNIATRLLRSNDTSINITYIADGKTKSTVLRTYLAKDITLYIKYEVTDTCFKLLGDNIAYINNGSLKKVYLPSVWKDLENTKGLIIDDRNYPSDFVIFELGKYLMPKATPFVKFTSVDLQQPGLFRFGKELEVGRKNINNYKGKLVILVNEVTQSSAEYHAMAYRVFPDAVVMGSTTAGADGNVSQFFLPGGLSTMISGIGVYYPDGRETQGIGIVPDIVVKPTIAGIKAGRDEVLEKALQYLR